MTEQFYGDDSVRIKKTAKEEWVQSEFREQERYRRNYYGTIFLEILLDKMQQKEEIFCDDISCLDMMNRIFRGRVIPLIVIFCCLVFQAGMSMTEHGEQRYTIVFAILLVIYGITFLQFAVKYFAFRKKVKK